ncbi:MAG: hypothetical protein ACRDG4_13270, partial [Chloroflexota bacterium]
MNVISSGRPKRPSKLLDALRSRAQGGGSGHLGFGATHTEVKRRLILVASLSAFDKGALRAIAGAGADGIEVTIRGTQDLAALGALLPDMAIPVGIVLDAAESGEDLGSIIEAAGVDWIRLSLQSSALALAWEKTARFVTIPEDLELRRVPALN